mgnify:CR=1 FL=1
MENDKIKISVIVTIHNAEKYIRECLTSVIGQTFSEIEILCMDGGSIDSTPQILREYAEKDGRIKIIDDPDTSYGHKVNRGIEAAKGEYISVLESDDMYEEFMLEKLYETAELYHADFVNGDYICFYDINGRRFGHVTKMYAEENYNCLINYREKPERFGIIPRYWTGLFRKEYLKRESIKMNESPGASYQDMSFRFLTSILAERAYHLNIPVYRYRIDNPESSMYDSKKTIVIAEEHEYLEKELQKRNIMVPYIWYNALQWKYTDFRGNMRHLKGSYRQELFVRYLEELERDRPMLEEYGGFGFRHGVTEMISEPPGVVAAMIDTDTEAEAARVKRLHQFLNKVTGIAGTKGIVLFGCGRIGSSIMELFMFEHDLISCLTDNSESLWNTNIRHYKVLPPEEATRRYPEALYIIANKLHALEIRVQLHSMGISDSMICIY